MPFSVKQLTLLISIFSSFTTIGAAPTSYAQNQTSEYDIIVVGGGAGGLVAATKFAESGMNTLLLEHGGPMLYLDGNREFPSWTQTEYPGNNLTIHDGMLFYVSAYTNPNNWCTNLPSGLLAACQLGGGTAVNAAQQFWPPKKYLTNAYGNIDGWTADAFQPAIQRVASRIPPTPYWSADNKFYYDQVYDIMGAPLTKLGLLEVNTTSEGDKKYDNYGRDVFAAIGGQRGGPMRGYLQDAKKLPNFTMKLYSPVTSVVRNGSQITGVKVNGTTINAKSVVLSAGVWNTPSLLFASGIGPKSVLDTAASINFTTYPESDWIINNGVGANLHDNPMTSLSISLNDTSSAPFYSLSNALNGSLPQADKDALYFNRSGPLTSPGRQLVGWIEEPFPNDSSKSMVIQTICSTPTAVDGQFTCQWNLNEGLLSRGQIILGTDGNLAFEGGVGPWLSDPEGIDVQVFAGALKRMVASINATPGMTVTTPASNVTDYVSFLNTAAKRSNNHWGGSCTVGTTDGTKNGTDCVDLNAKVYGTNNLFVIDGSLSRAPTTSNPAFLYEAIAELASVKVMESLGVEAKLSNAVTDISL